MAGYQHHEVKARETAAGERTFTQDQVRSALQTRTRDLERRLEKESRRVADLQADLRRSEARLADVREAERGARDSVVGLQRDVEVLTERAEAAEEDLVRREKDFVAGTARDLERAKEAAKAAREQRDRALARVAELEATAVVVLEGIAPDTVEFAQAADPEAQLRMLHRAAATIELLITDRTRRRNP